MYIFNSTYLSCATLRAIIAMAHDVVGIHSGIDSVVFSPRQRGSRFLGLTAKEDDRIVVYVYVQPIYPRIANKVLCANNEHSFYTALAADIIDTVLHEFHHVRELRDGTMVWNYEAGAQYDENDERASRFAKNIVSTQLNVHKDVRLAYDLLCCDIRNHLFAQWRI